MSFNRHPRFILSALKSSATLFVDGTKLSGAVDSPEGRDAVQRDLGRLGEWAHGNLMKFNKGECRVLHLGWGNPQHRHRLGGGWVESSPAEKDSGTLVGDKLDMSRQRALAAQKVKRILGGITGGVASRSREGILPLCSTRVRPHQEHRVQLWGPQCKTGMDLLERVQRRPRKWSEGWSTSAVKKG
ncbi:hypothetical protein QYF61_015029 [Mycteria americana]|uniref:Rna-directed dna polymerase from mobile element jockey-like n=1 Tax=Mycteria americana TaxID=33587 RepID=A0AAN7NC18_MYCAM|nr:hypothetical protein QYF61_015029 [Mycteria americana]